MRAPLPQTPSRPSKRRPASSSTVIPPPPPPSPHSAYRKPKASNPKSKASNPKPEASKTSIPLLTLVCDAMILLISLGLGLLLHALVLIIWPPTANPSDGQMLQWMPLLAITSTASWYLLIDLLRCGYAQARLPFNYLQRDVQRFYWKRLELILSIIAAHILLLCLCLLMPGKPLISKLFLTAIAALVAFAVRQTIPSRRQAFAASMGVFSLAMLMVAIVGTIFG